jgi:hypothetical protein
MLITIDLGNAYNAMRRSAFLERHRGHTTLRRAVSYRRAKLGPGHQYGQRRKRFGETTDYNKGPPLQGRPLLLLYNLGSRRWKGSWRQ